MFLYPNKPVRTYDCNSLVQTLPKDKWVKIKDFLREICFQLSAPVKDGEELPPDFAQCAEFRSEYNDEEPDEDDLKQHYSCVNCFARVRLKPGIDKEEFYQKHHQAWYAESPRKEYVDHNATYSRADTAEANKALRLFRNTK